MWDGLTGGVEEDVGVEDVMDDFVLDEEIVDCDAVLEEGLLAEVKVDDVLNVDVVEVLKVVELDDKVMLGSELVELAGTTKAAWTFGAAPTALVDEDDEDDEEALPRYLAPETPLCTTAPTEPLR